MALAAIRAVSPPVTDDRVLSPEIAKMADVIAAGKLGEALR